MFNAQPTWPNKAKAVRSGKICLYLHMGQQLDGRLRET
jgi:hypothetical protein